MLVVALIVASPKFAADDSDEKAKPTFQRDILPILQKRCARCHAGETPKGGLNVLKADTLLFGGESGPALRVGAAESSLLYERISSDAMPKGGPPLSSKEKGVIRTWINDGASELAAKVGFNDNSDGAVNDAFWSFVPPQRHQPPASHDPRSRTPIDDFLGERLASESLTMSPPAGPLVQLRRLYFDLTGLPPSPEDVRRYLSDRRADAYSREVERLLASPSYGERWGRHWLDVAGYADSAGVLSEDRPLPLAWRYRDYVVRAFNADKGYDRFLVEQIAGDEATNYWHAHDTMDRLPDEVVEGITATGFLRMAADSSRPDFTTIKNAHSQYYYPTLQDTLQIVASATMGLTLQCARCHSHKFDPIRQTEYYQLQAIFMAALRPNQWVPQMERRLFVATASQKKVQADRDAEIKAAVTKLEAELKSLEATFADQLYRKRLDEIPESDREAVAAAFSVEPEKRTSAQKSLVASHKAKLRPAGEELTKALREVFADFVTKADEIKAEVAHQNRRKIYYDEIRALYDLPGEVVTPVLLRGDALTPGPPVEPGVPTAIGATQAFQWTKPLKGAKTSGRRLAFARWLTQPQHPLTARVIVNRLWMHHFGVGIVNTPEDFGMMGDRPSHPALLDWLAIELIEHDWSLKHIHRLIVTSHAYRQRSQVSHDRQRIAHERDPENRLLWKQNMRRLEAEALRDSVLAVAGQLDQGLYGYPTPMERHSNGEVTPLTGRNGNRRAIYMQVLRLTPLTFLQVMDQPMMSTNCTQRRQSTVALQALTLMNSKRATEAARGFADRVRRDFPIDPVHGAVVLAWGRSPDNDEQELMNEFLLEQRQRHASSGQDASAAEIAALVDLCHMLLSSNEFAYID